MNASQYTAYYTNQVLRPVIPQPNFNTVKADSGIGSANNTSSDDSTVPSTNDSTVATALFSVPSMPRVNMLEPFCTVPGRLTLLSNTKKYRVSILIGFDFIGLGYAGRSFTSD